LIKMGTCTPPASYILSLLEKRWRQGSELAKLLHCPPVEVHNRLLDLAHGEFTVVCLESTDQEARCYATLRKGWRRTDLLKLIQHSKPN